MWIAKVLAVATVAGIASATPSTAHARLARDHGVGDVETRTYPVERLQVPIHKIRGLSHPDRYRLRIEDVERAASPFPDRQGPGYRLRITDVDRAAAPFADRRVLKFPVSGLLQPIPE